MCNKMKKENFCSLPFKGIFLGSDGAVKPCCSLRGVLGNINEKPLEEILNDEPAKSLRKSIIDGEWHDMCSQCNELEQRGARTERLGIIEDFDKMKDDLLTPESFILKRLDLRWSNTCNLTCTYCNSYFSSKWAEIEGVKVNNVKADGEESVFSFIEKQKDSVENLILLGGEPLLQKPNNRLLEILPNASYYILTNLSNTLENNKLAQALATDKVGWGISFENIGARFEYVRHGASWDRLVHNLRFLHERKVRSIDIHPIYCVYSALNLCEFYEFVENEGYINNLYWQMLQNIEGLDVFRAPLPFKVKAAEELEKCFELYGDKYNMDLLKPIYDNLKESISGPFHPSSKPQFDWLDEIERSIAGKKEQFIELWPELYEVMKDSYNVDYPGPDNKIIYIRKEE